LARPMQTLSGIRLRDLKSFSDSGPIKFGGLNLLIGANNAGKSTFLSAVELFFRSMRAGGFEGPLAFESMPGFASFDSSLRRHWNRSTQRPTKIVFNYEWTVGGDRPATRSYEFQCTSRGTDDALVVSQATYAMADEKTSWTVVREVDAVSDRARYVARSSKKGSVAKKDEPIDELWFHQMVPYEVIRQLRKKDFFYGYRPTELEVVNPYRPVPRSFYVLDDPNLAAEDRGLLTYLIRLWSSKEAEEKKVRERLNSSLQKLNLTQYFEVSQVSKKIGPKVIEIRVAPTSSRQKVTIADAGFGLSQFLPLAVYDARLVGGALIAYQPEVHLHPFAQSRLADVFVDSLNRGNQLFVETHSVDLLLRLQSKIATGDVNPDDVRVFCFENRNGKSELSQMTFDESGAPSRTWPEGFVDTSLKLARELTSARISKLQRAGK
jgi:AAA ATPase domain